MSQQFTRATFQAVSTELVPVPRCDDHGVPMVYARGETYEQRWVGVWYFCPAGGLAGAQYAAVAATSHRTAVIPHTLPPADRERWAKDRWPA